MEYKHFHIWCYKMHSVRCKFYRSKMGAVFKRSFIYHVACDGKNISRIFMNENAFDDNLFDI